ncbi:MAG TPA: hypothetical protein VIQ02_10990 [Jiangellaceae bacterium]|jgi:hypothetical protein|nr:hypothetical protein [Actinomycetes bacterium]
MTAQGACDQLWVSGQDSTNQKQFAIQQAAKNPEVDEEVHVFWQHYWDCLLCSYPDHSGDLVAVTMISDFYSARAYHASGMYVDYLGPRAVEHEIMVCRPLDPGGVCAATPPASGIRGRAASPPGTC